MTKKEEESIEIGELLYHLSPSERDAFVDYALEESAPRVQGREYIRRDLICPSGKDTYLTYYDAQNALKQRGKDNKKPYHCDLCGYYHLTSKVNKTGIKQKKYSRKHHRQVLTEPKNIIPQRNELYYEEIKKKFDRGEYRWMKSKKDKVMPHGLKSTDLGDLLKIALEEKETKKEENNYVEATS